MLRVLEHRRQLSLRQQWHRAELQPAPELQVLLLRFAAKAQRRRFLML